jgi:hypothetical protein
MSRQQEEVRMMAGKVFENMISVPWLDTAE